jgi:hypothetical protein
MTAKARALGNADEAVDSILVEELAKAPKPLDTQEAWGKVMGVVYGDEERGVRLLELAKDRGLVPTTGLSPMNMPTVDALRAVDQALMKANVPGLAGARGTSRFTSWLAPDYQKALLKVAVDEGTKKALAAKGRYTEQVGSAVEALTRAAAERPAGSERVLTALMEADPCAGATSQGSGSMMYGSRMLSGCLQKMGRNLPSLSRASAPVPVVRCRLCWVR